MKASTIVLLGLAGVAGFFALEHKASASTPKTSNLPPGWTPPSGATFTTIAASNPTGVALDVWSWRDATGNTMAMFLSHTNPMNDYAVFITPPSGGGTHLMATGTTPLSGLIAQAGASGQLK